jgi:predicted ABC-type transport system involved in lysophospholipase L1 biosynthesis ATPase subunit
VTPAPADPLVLAEDLRVTARAGALRVEGLTFRLDAPGALVLVGPVEAGSAVLRALLGIERPDGGVARLLGEDPGALPRARAAGVLSRVGFHPRSGSLLANLTLRENLLLPLQFHRRLAARDAARAAAAALERFGLGDAPEIRPEEAPLPLRRRVALARATLLDPDLLVLDDPLDDLEEDVAREVVDALAAWSRERPRALLVASHLAGTAAALRAPALPLPVTRA